VTGTRSIRLAVRPAEVWAALVAGGRRDWYYRLTPDVPITMGAHVTWVDGRGEVAEESDVVGLEAPRTLSLRSRFMFSPDFAGCPQHSVSWVVAGDGGVSEVTMTWDAEGPAARLLESEAELQLRGLRLQVDPAAGAELSRVAEIGEVEIRDVTPDLVGDYQRFFDHDAFADFPAWQGCYCMETHRTQSDSEWAVRTAADNRKDMSEALAAARVTALLAYAGGRPVGWCNFGRTTALAGVMHRFELQPAECEGVASVSCFVIAPAYRGHGIASRLLAAAVDRLRDSGARVVEGYPARVQDSPQTAYRGPLSMYLRAGFAPYRETSHHVVVRKSL
jgi:GNAT superfamily N-acetyltransferase